MKEIIKVLLQEGIDEVMINRVLDLIEEEYEVIDERNDRELLNKVKRAYAETNQAEEKLDKAKEKGEDTEALKADYDKKFKKAMKSHETAWGRTYRREALAGRKTWNRIKNGPTLEMVNQNRTKVLNQRGGKNEERIARQETLDKNTKAHGLALTKKVNGKQALRAPYYFN